MNILLYSDVHWSTYSSIIRKRNDKYSQRLDVLINSMNWVEDLAEKTNCEYSICLGDFFDQANLTSEEITALNEVKWKNHSHIFLVGNHEMGINNLSKSSSHIFNLIKNCKVIDSPYSMLIDETQFDFLPYVLESDRKKLNQYFTKNPKANYYVLFSHNDIKGLQLGKYISKEGFDLEEIDSNYDLCINGHLHNGSRISQHTINIGNLVGQNFSEDALKFNHCVFILNTDTLTMDIYENPYSFNFYKIDASENLNINFKQNSVCTVKCKQNELNNIKKYFESNPNICEVRYIIQPEINIKNEDVKESFSVDHLKSFKEYVMNNIGTTDSILAELEEICKCS